MNNISFKANYITSIGVLRKNQEGKYQSDSISVASIDFNNKNDRNAINEVCEKWSGNIFCDCIKDNKQNVWIATSQKNEKSLESFLDSNKILCLVNMNLQPNKTNIFHIETVPNSINDEYNHVGTEIIEYIKTKTKRIELFCPSTKIIKQFYYKLGFVHKAPNSTKIIDYGELYWLRNPKSVKGLIFRLFNKIYYNFIK